jgi:hypothetical protein
MADASSWWSRFWRRPAPTPSLSASDNVAVIDEGFPDKGKAVPEEPVVESVVLPEPEAPSVPSLHALAVDPWTDMYDCTDPWLWRERAEAHGLGPVEWCELPENAPQCAPSHRVHRRSPLRWCLEALPQPEVRLAALRAWVDIGASPSHDIPESATTINTWPPLGACSGPSLPDKSSLALWHLARSAEEEDLLRTHALPDWGQAILLPTPPEPAPSSLMQDMLAHFALLNRQSTEEQERWSASALLRSRSAPWTRQLLDIEGASDDSTNPALHNLLTKRLHLLNDPSFDAGTEEILGRLPSQVTLEAWAAWLHQAVRAWSDPADIEKAHAKENWKSHYLFEELKIKKNVLKGRKKDQAPSARYASFSMPSDPPPQASASRVMDWGRRLRERDALAPEHLLTVMCEHGLVPYMHRGVEPSVSDLQALGRACRDIMGDAVDWSPALAHLSTHPDPTLLRVLLGWGMPPDPLPGGLGLLQQWLAHPEKSQQAIEVLLDANPAGAVDATGLDPFQWSKALVATGLSVRLHEALASRLLSLHERRVLQDTLPVEDLPAGRRPRV